MPVGALLGGLIAEQFGVVSVFLLAGVGTLGMLAFRPILTDAAIDAAELPDGAAGGAGPV
jgi:hypothetical protein